MKQFSLNSPSEDVTRAAAYIVGKNLRGGEVIELVSDIGGGKTTFTKGLVKGVGSDIEASSPTFVIKHEYVAGDLRLHHLDLYRLNDLGILKEATAEVLDDSKSILIIEWAGLAQEILPKERIIIELTPKSLDERIILITYPEKLSYIVSGLEKYKW